MATEKVNRIAHYDAICAMDGEAAEAVQDLWKLRYEQKRLLAVLPDAFLNAMMDLLYIASQKPSGLSRRSLQKQTMAAAKALGLDGWAQQKESWQTLALREYGNCAMYFMQLGREDGSYSRGAFNLYQLNEKKLREKLYRDLYCMAVEVPETYGLTELFEPFRQGVMSAFETVYPNS